MARRRNEATAALAAMVVAALGVAAPGAGQTGTDEGVWTAISLRGKVSADAAWRWSADSFVQSRDGGRWTWSGRCRPENNCGASSRRRCSCRLTPGRTSAHLTATGCSSVYGR